MKSWKRFWPVTPYIVFLMMLITVMTVLSAALRDSTKLLLVNITITAFAAASYFLLSDYMSKNTRDYLRRLSSELSADENASLANIPLPVVTVAAKGEIIWYNDEFCSMLLNGGNAHGSNITKVIKKFELVSLESSEPFEIRNEKKWFSCSVRKCGGEDGDRYAVYFTDITGLKRTEQEYNDSRPAVILIMFDNEEELLKERESERMRIMGEIDSLINRWVSDTTGICWADARDKSLIVIEDIDLRKIIADKFSILNDVRNIRVKENIAATLSIGVGYGGKNIAECEAWARQALDMALGRGGDQAAVRGADGYSFYGGVTNSAERQSRVRMRMFATAIVELISQCENCFIMGHRYSDLDVIGSAAGMYSLVKAMDKEVYIVVEREASLAKELIDGYEKAVGNSQCFMEPFDALDRIRDGTLVIIVDTHSPGFVESKALYERATTTIVIDHHRMMVDYIDDSTLFIQESYASSASEMVTELATYINDKAIKRPEAEALLAGIMLDTKSFVLKTGVRTFEAAAFLRRRGADTVEVKRFFSGSLDTYIEKSSLVSSAMIYRDCAVSYAEDIFPNIRVVAAQAADDMLAIKNVNASFVLYESDGCTNISARSLGKVNVQLIMEALGGGGHLTMAGAQLKGVRLEDALEQLYDAIDAVSGKI